MTARKYKQYKSSYSYRNIENIDGSHPFKEKVPHAYVEYRARKRKNGSVVHFNFSLAKEMGLIPKKHPNELNPELEKTLLDTFGLMIINEWDIEHKKKYPEEEIKEHSYMATRYLQLQHPDKVGMRSGDGRSIWNGYFKGRDGRTWDISSCGTGATCLSPAVAHNNTFYKSGDPSISYGCGYSHLSEGVIDLLFSEIFNSNNILTERVLCVISFPGNFGVTVRAGLNLLRPSHFFNHLRQGRLDRLQNAIDFFIDRELSNGTWDPIPKGMNRYDYLVDQITYTFAKICAKFESDYVFCWLDWDGDNILADGGVIDFGSVRQFGLYHHSYKFDDDDRWSTNLKEQKYKAKHIIMSFAQAADYIKTGVRKKHSQFKNHKSLKNFDRIMKVSKRLHLLRKMGFDDEAIEDLASISNRTLNDFEKVFYQFESARSKKGFTKVPDGINWNAVYCMRDILRELPELYLQELRPIKEKAFLEIMKSQFVDRNALKRSSHKKRQIKAFQEGYIKLVKHVARKQGRNPEDVLTDIKDRSAIINRFERITGDSICFIGEKIAKLRKKMNKKDYHQMISIFLDQQVLNPDKRKKNILTKHLSPQAAKFIKQFEDILKSYREGI